MKTSFLKKGLLLLIIALPVAVSTAFIPAKTKSEINTTYHFILVCEKDNTFYLSEVIDNNLDKYSSCKDKAMASYQDYIKDKYNVSGRVWAADYTDLKTSQAKKQCLSKFKNVESITYIETVFSYNCN